MLNEPRIAVLMAAYNGENWLNEQLQSILSQKDVDVQIFISLDQSTDRSKSLIEAIAINNPKINFLGEVVCGSAGKNFYGIIKNKKIFGDFDYYCLADQDDIWLENKLSRAVEKLKESRSSGYSSNVTAFWPSGEKKMIVKSQPQKKWDYLFEAAGPGCTYVIDSYLYNDLVEFLCTLETPVEKFEAHDWLIYAFARSRSYSWIIDEKSHMLYRQHASNQVGANKGVKAYLKRFRAVMSGGWFDRVEILIKILGLYGQGPANLLLQRKPSCYLKMAFQTGEFRRKKSEQYFLSFFFIMYAFRMVLLHKSFKD